MFIYIIIYVLRQLLVDKCYVKKVSYLSLANLLISSWWSEWIDEDECYGVFYASVFLFLSLPLSLSLPVFLFWMPFCVSQCSLLARDSTPLSLRHFVCYRMSSFVLRFYGTCKSPMLLLYLLFFIHPFIPTETTTRIRSTVVRLFPACQQFDQLTSIRPHKFDQHASAAMQTKISRLVDWLVFLNFPWPSSDDERKQRIQLAQVTCTRRYSVNVRFESFGDLPANF